MAKGSLEQALLETPVGFAESRERIYCALGVLFLTRPGEQIPVHLLDRLETSLNQLSEGYSLRRLPSAEDGGSLGIWLEQWSTGPGLRASQYRNPCDRSRDPGGSTLLRLQEMFSRKRFQPGPALPPDHLGTQLAFMADLCWREREAWSQGDFGRAVHWLQEQRTFILEHLAQWVPMLTREVEASDCCAIAKDLMVLLDEFISDEADSIGLWIMQAQMVSETLDHPLTAGKI